MKKCSSESLYDSRPNSYCMIRNPLSITLRVQTAMSGACRSAAGQCTPAGAPQLLAATQMYHRVSAHDVALQMQWFGKGAKENLPSQMRCITEVLWVHLLHRPLLVVGKYKS